MKKNEVKKGFEKWNRKIHIYLGLFMLLFIWLFSVSGLFMNHPKWFHGKIERTPTDIPITYSEGLDEVALAKELRDQLELEGEIILRAQRNPEKFGFMVMRPNKRFGVNVDLATNVATVNDVKSPSVGILGDLHTFSGVRAIWNEPVQERDTRDLRSATYGVDPETGYLDIESIADLADRLRPTLIVLGWSAYSRSIDFARIRAIADRAGSLLHVDMTQFAGLVAADLYPNPVPFADFVTASVRPTLDGPNSGILIAREGWKSRIANAISPGLQGGQSQNIVAALAVCLGQAQDEPFRARQRATVRNARALAAALARGSIRIVSGGTDVHQVLVDTRDLGFDRFEAEHRLAQVAIWAQGLWSNRSESFHPALRFSTKAVTARKFTPKDMEAVGRIVVSALDHDADQAELDSLRTECEQLAKSHPLPFAYM